ncbi:MAG: hypothetical protein JMDDDDMK_04302 [Acidobacteria bacterium]|nr:hypothetical protein [Acidobacteriota bacterium]
MKESEIPEKLFVTHSEEADKVVAEAVRQELLKRKKLGLSASAWRDGKVVIVPPEEIPVSEIEPEPIERIKQ